MAHFLNFIYESETAKGIFAKKKVLYVQITIKQRPITVTIQIYIYLIKQNFQYKNKSKSVQENPF